MNQRIIYPTESGIMVLIPCECGLPISEIARKDVPQGVPYLIVDASEIPDDRTYRDAWQCDFSSPDGYGIGAAAWFAGQNALPNHEPLPDPQPDPEQIPADPGDEDPPPVDGTDRNYPTLPS